MSKSTPDQTPDLTTLANYEAFGGIAVELVPDPNSAYAAKFLGLGLAAYLNLMGGSPVISMDSRPVAMQARWVYEP